MVSFSIHKYLGKDIVLRKMKPRSLAPYRPLRLTSNLRFILRAKDTESLFDVEATRRALRGKNIDLEAVLRPGLYWHVRPAPNPLG